ncbi:hypothetical protein M2475_001966 [Breznakia sp. PF5-3]|uniref:DUF2691 family protein n=1 Tax=unclassified Breznakia TaxID=2623764 RepID=UPI00240766F6|nr:MULTISPECIES: DUF2691 family protein [unclassified Breznakia]MDL2276676.1 DUF2691 family protein [Breznakia sp. OttesenSCG-928-G09]MDF9825519.1 hypothetical protein [Breznakia sp. PM6-1]MDF9836386.1 hypothetical protein [Breznakia sp. PF5-3]MDF9838730.1 hypothetical protein [Breznakia sp. PFB2-8]MDF9860538.1 hypothetical protein [Breznakia sp. PH5-24]
MDGAILQGRDIYYNNSKIYYTDLNVIVEACKINTSQYNWLITQYECNYYPTEELENKRHDYIWLTGKDFNELIQNETLQFIWGIIIAFPLTTSLEDVLKNQLPTYKTEKYFPSLSIIEIISEDSSFVKVFSNQKDFIQNFRDSIPEARNI